MTFFLPRPHKRLRHVNNKLAKLVILLFFFVLDYPLCHRETKRLFSFHLDEIFDLFLFRIETVDSVTIKNEADGTTERFNDVDLEFSEKGVDSVFYLVLPKGDEVIFFGTCSMNFINVS